MLLAPGRGLVEIVAEAFQLFGRAPFAAAPGVAAFGPGGALMRELKRLVVVERGDQVAVGLG